MCAIDAGRVEGRVSIFHIDFYAKDWILKTQRLTLEERGAFIQIVAVIYEHQGPIDNDAQWLSNLCNCSVRKMKAILDSLFGKGFLTARDGKITQKRAEEELENAQKRREKSSKNAQKRRENEPKTERKTRENSFKNERKNDEKERVLIENNDLISASYQLPDIIKKDNPSDYLKKTSLDDLSVDHIREWLSQKRAVGRYLNIDEHALLEKFKDYCRAKSPKYRDYAAAFRNAFDWSNAPQKGGRNEPTGPKPTRSQRADEAAERALAKLNAGYA